MALALASHNLPTDRARELFKPCTDFLGDVTMGIGFRNEVRNYLAYKSHQVGWLIKRPRD